LAYTGDKLILDRNDLLTIQAEGASFNTDPGAATQVTDVVAFESASFSDKKETIVAETVRGSRSRNKKNDTLWSVEGEIEAIYRGGRDTGADSSAALPGDDEVYPEGMENLLGSHFGVVGAEYAAAATHAVTPSTVTTLELVVGDGSKFQRGDLVVWYDITDATARARFVAGVATDTLTIWPALAAGDIPAVDTQLFGRAQYRYAGTAVQHPSLFAKANQGFDGTNALIKMFGGLKANELTIDIPLSDFAKFRFGLQGVRTGTDPAYGAVAGGVTQPRNPNFGVLGLNNTFCYYSRNDGSVYGLCPLSLSVTSSFEVHRITCLEDLNTARALRLGMRDVTAQLDVVLDDPALMKDFRDSDRISIIHLAGRDSYFNHANWSPWGFNAFALGLPQCSIDDINDDEYEDTKKVTLTLSAEVPDFETAQATNVTGWDQEMTFCCLGSANTS